LGKVDRAWRQANHATAPFELQLQMLMAHQLNKAGDILFLDESV